MTTYNWEEKWEKYGIDYASKIHHIPLSNKKKWLSDFLQSAIITTNILIPSIMTFILEFNLKITKFEPEKFQKKLYKMKREEIEHVIKIFLMDYLATFLEHPTHEILIDAKNIEKDKLIQEMINILNFNKKERKIFKEIVAKTDTYYPSILFLESISLGKEAKNGGLLGGIEIMKEEIYNKIDNGFQKIIKTTFKE